MEIEIDMKIRMNILKNALLVEGMTSHFLGGLLNIKDVKNSASLGNTGSALSFNQKINLLIDIGALQKDSKTKFQKFMEIRNQFMHNIEAKNFEICFTFVGDGTEKYILKTYPQNPRLTKEVQLENAVNALSSDVVNQTIQIIDKINAKFSKESEADLYKSMLIASHKSIKDSIKIIDEYLETQLSQKTSLKPEQFKLLGTQIGKIIFKKIKNDFEESIKSSK